jgi:hypothetical protein
MKPAPRVQAVAVAGCLLLAAGGARAEDPIEERELPTRRATFETDQGWVTMTVSFRDVVNPKIRRKLLSGLPTTIATRAYVFPDKDKQPVALSAQTCKVVFDLWDEVFRIDLHQAGSRKQTVAANVEGVMRRCTEARRLPLVALTTLSPSRAYFVGVLVEVNPLSKEILEKIRRWVARPKGASAVGPGDSLFGSFVGLFITQVPEADRSLGFQTQQFVPSTLPPVPKKKGDQRAGL